MNLVLDAVIRSSIVLAIGLAAVWLLRRQPAALRHWVPFGNRWMVPNR